MLILSQNGLLIFLAHNLKNVKNWFRVSSVVQVINSSSDNNREYTISNPLILVNSSVM